MSEPTSDLLSYLQGLFKNFEENRRTLEEKWRKNWNDYKSIPGLRVHDGYGVGNNKKTSDPDKKDWKSEAVSNMARIKINAGQILVSDVLLSTGAIPFMLKENKMIGDLIGGVLFPQAESPEEESQRDNSAPIQQMTRLIQQQLVRAAGDVALKKDIVSSAIYGEGITKVSLKTFKTKKFRNDGGQWCEEVLEDEGLTLKNVSVWDFFTDLEGRNIQSNRGIFERSMISRSELLSRFRNDPDVFQEKLRMFSSDRYSPNPDNAPTDSNLSPGLKMLSKRRNEIKLLEFWGKAPESAVKNFEMKSNGFTSVSDNDSDVEIMAVLADDKIIKLSRVDSEMRPYFRTYWEESYDDVSGDSVADSVVTLQDSLTSLLRSYEDNKKLSSNIVIAMKRRLLEDQGDDGAIYPGKIIDVSESARSVSEAIQPMTLPDVGNAILQGIDYYNRAANDASMIPEIAYGNAPDKQTTAYEISTRNEKAGKYISDIVRGKDNDFIEPVIRFFYNWNMMDPRVPDQLKGCYDVEALGFHSYQDKVLKMNKMKEVMQMALSTPMLTNVLNIELILRKYLEANDLDPDMFVANGQTPMLEQRFQNIEQTLQQIQQSIPAAQRNEELAAAEQQARIGKIQVETEKMKTAAFIETEKVKNDRARTIAAIEKGAAPPQ